MVKIKKVSESGTGEDKSLRKEKGEKRKGRQREQHKELGRKSRSAAMGREGAPFQETRERKRDKRHVGM